MCLSNCQKENAKHVYIYSLNFSNGEKVQMRVTIREKVKSYTDKADRTFWRNNKDYISLVFGEQVSGTMNRVGNTSMLMIKTEEKTLITNAKSYIRFFGSSFTGVADFEMLGSFTCSGSYQPFGRKIEVEDGSFSFEWNNAEYVGKNDTILTGTWTLKRE
jgi:hypothetical protein